MICFLVMTEWSVCVCMWQFVSRSWWQSETAAEWRRPLYTTSSRLHTWQQWWAVWSICRQETSDRLSAECVWELHHQVSLWSMIVHACLVILTINWRAAWKNWVTSLTMFLPLLCYLGFACLDLISKVYYMFFKEKYMWIFKKVSKLCYSVINLTHLQRALAALI